MRGETREGPKVVISGDTSPWHGRAFAADRADLLVHEATFTDEELDRARETGHSTALQAARLARDANVHLLALTHISMRYAGGELRDEARDVFAATEVPRDFDTIEIPFPERGAPHLVRWAPERAQPAAALAAAAAQAADAPDATEVPAAAAGAPGGLAPGVAAVAPEFAV